MQYFSRDFSAKKSSATHFDTLFEIALVVVGIMASSYFFYPGCMSGDTWFSLDDALKNSTPSYYNWDPPLVAYAWHLLSLLPFTFSPNYSSLFIVMNMLYWTGLVLAIHPWIHRKLLWVIFFIYLAFFPPGFAIVSQTLKDSLMCAALMAAYGGLLIAEGQNSRLAFAFGLLNLFLALGFRHNALFAVFPLAMWAGIIFCQNNPKCTWRKKIIAGMTIFSALFACAFTSNTLLTKESAYPIQGIYAFDLVGISALTGQVYLPDLYNNDKKPFLFPIVGAEIKGNTTSIENIRLLYSPDRSLNIYWYGEGKGLRILHSREEMDTLQQAWLHAILQEPLTYLKVRTDLYLYLIGVTNSKVWRYYCLDPNASATARLPNYYLNTHGSLLFRGILYIGIILPLFIIACLKRDIFPLHIRVIGASALVYLASYFFIGVGADFRYLYWLIPVSLIMAVNMTFIALTPLLYLRNKK